LVISDDFKAFKPVNVLSRSHPNRAALRIEHPSGRKKKDNWGLTDQREN
jgi:hypothetical protein